MTTDRLTLCTTVERRAQQVVVLDEQLWVILPHIQLAEEAHDPKGGKAAVDTREEIACVPEYDAGVEVAEHTPLWAVFVRQPQWRGHQESQ